jgi:transcriptional regulator with XRE-family HTH domain
MATVAACKTPSPRSGPIECESAASRDRMRRLRIAHGLTQAKLAGRPGITQSATARLEAGQQQMSLLALKRAALALSFDVRVVIAERGA